MRSRIIEGFRGKYLITEKGEVLITSQNNRMKKCYTDKNGYIQVSLWNGDKYIVKRIARLVAEYFLSTWNPILEVNHIDGIKTNNNVSNLEMTTRSENQQHAVNIGLQPSGIRHHYSKFSEAEIIQIRNLKNSFTQRQLANIFKVSQHTIMMIQTYKTYRSVL